MENNDYPRLCGGTFFVLLLQAIQQRRKARDRFESGSDGLNATNVLIGLIRVSNLEYSDPPQTTFRNNASTYKSCNVSDGTYLPFADEAFVSAFDTRVKNEYQSALTTMSGFVSQFIDTGSTEKHIRLVKALLELVEKDPSIADKDLFYANYDGRPMEKTALCRENDICLSAFLLGIWHFIVQNRKDNTIGKATFESWHEKPDEKGAKWVYSGHIGEGITRLINVTIPVPSDSEDEIFSSVDDDNSNESDVGQDSDQSSNDSANTTSQTIDRPIVFSQKGNNNIQIGSIGTLTINNG